MTTILLVEDDPKNVTVFSRYLERLGGFAVKHSEDVEEVLHIAQARECDLILMDVSLTHSVYQGKPVDGIGLTQMLKQDPKTASLPIVLVTAHAMEGDRDNFLNQSGADYYISKPIVDYHKLVEQLLALLPQSEIP